MSGVIINLPYTATGVPPAVAKRLPLTPEDWQLEHWRLIDPCLADLARKAAAFERRSHKVERPVIVYPWSPVVADPWGLWAAELMNGGESPAPPPGQAATLPRTTAGRPLNWLPKDRDTIFSRTVTLFHQEIEEEARRRLEKKALILVVTLRSFTSIPWAFEKNKRDPRPQASIGTEKRVTPEGLAYLAGDVFRAFRWWPERNWPQDHGACLPPGLAGHPRVRALGISLDRGLYLDERGRRREAPARSAVRVLQTLFNLLDQELDRVAKVRLDRVFKPKESSIIKAPRKAEQ